jgi:hypothetical protein
MTVQGLDTFPHAKESQSTTGVGGVKAGAVIMDRDVDVASSLARLTTASRCGRTF